MQNRQATHDNKKSIYLVQRINKIDGHSTNKQLQKRYFENLIR